MVDSPEIFIIKSDISELRNVEKFLFLVFERNHLPQKYFNKVLLCISEAVINAIEHGNKSDREKKVIIHLCCIKKVLLIEIHDQGEGFNYKCLNDPTNENNIRKETGRGIHIMKSIAKSLSYHDHGKILKIEISLE